ncbi:P-selectin glycoprotein ligand 1-like [Clinocottus analis]|uniref:P-selectin glycoprotein ligand 1-like n=1 Tax=Clinocottus analis TaxID=304258 RepID=UPI0035BFC0CD
MMPLTMKTYLAVLWGVSVVYAMESDMNKTSSINSMTEPHKPAEISVTSPAEPTVETKEAIGTDRTEPQRLHTPAAVNTTAGAAHPSHNTVILETANPREDQRHQQSTTTSTYTTPRATASLAAVSVSSRQPSSTTKSEVPSKLPPVTSPENVHAPVFNQTPSVPAATATTTMTARPTSEAEVFDPTKSEAFPTSAELVSTSKLVTKTSVATSQFPGTAGLNSSAESSTVTFSPISTSKVSTTDVSTSKVSTTKVSTTDISTTDISTTNISTTGISTTNISTTDISTTNISTTDISTTNISTINISTTDISTTNISTTDISTTNISTTDISTTGISITNISTTNISTTDISTTDISTSPLGILIPRKHNKSPVPTTKSTPLTTTAPGDVPKRPPGTEVQPCSTRHAAKRCLIAIASLAALATGFMVSTIILCTKLSKKKYKVNKPQPATEMMCISALLPERNITYSRQRNPVTNGVLVIHDDVDSDEDGGDNLTLTSFLPENDRFV